MVTLLLVSVALAASAPLLSKQMKSSATGNLQLQQLIQRIEELEAGSRIPAGAIMFIDADVCPDGWTRVDNNWNGRYPRFAGNYNICDKSGENAFGNCVNAVSSAVSDNASGNLYGDAIRNMEGQTTEVHNSCKNAEESGAFTRENGYNAGWGYAIGNQLWATLRFNASRVVPTAAENRPKTVTLLGCRKD